VNETAAAALPEREREADGRHYLILGCAGPAGCSILRPHLLFSFLLVPIRKSLGLDEVSLSLPRRLAGGTAWAGSSSAGCGPVGRKSVLSWTILVYFRRHVPHAGWRELRHAARVPDPDRPGRRRRMATGQTLVGETFPRRMRARLAAVMPDRGPAGHRARGARRRFAAPAFMARFGEDWGWRACFFISVLPALLVWCHPKSMPESRRVAGGARRQAGGGAGAAREARAASPRSSPTRPARLFAARPRPRHHRHVRVLVHLLVAPQVPLRPARTLHGKSGVWMLVTAGGRTDRLPHVRISRLARPPLASRATPSSGPWVCSR